MEHQGTKYQEGQFTRFLSPLEVEALDFDTLIAYCWWVSDLSKLTRRLQDEADAEVSKPKDDGPSGTGGDTAPAV